MPAMALFSLEVWVILGGIAAIGVLAVLYTLSETVRCESTCHDVRLKAARLRHHYLSQLRPESQPIIVVDEAPPSAEEPSLSAAPPTPAAPHKQAA
jgi:hypothetical protein